MLFASTALLLRHLRALSPQAGRRFHLPSVLLLRPAPIHHYCSSIATISSTIASRRRHRGCFLITRWLDVPVTAAAQLYAFFDVSYAVLPGNLMLVVLRLHS
jgi:hypothetical protein